MTRPKEPAPPDRGIILGGIRERALRAVREPVLIQRTITGDIIISTFKLSGPHQYVTSVEDISGGKAPSVGYYATRSEALRLHDGSSVQVIEQGDNTDVLVEAFAKESCGQ